MPKERFKVIPAVHLFLIKDGKILLSRRYNTGYEDGNYSVIAGHLDGQETATQTMVREAMEETGIIVEPNDLKVVHAMHRKKKGESEERVDFFFTAEKWQGEPNIKEPHKCDDLQWFSLSELPENIIPYVRAGLENYLNNNPFSEFGWDINV